MRAVPITIFMCLCCGSTIHAEDVRRPERADAYADASWAEGLTVGVNGPIPVVVVDQFGYATKAAKFAVIRNPQSGYDSAIHFEPGKSYAVVDRSNGNFVKTGSPIAWSGGETDPSSGDKAWWFDFSDVTTPGVYTVVDTEKNIRSVEFEINDQIYRRVLKHAVRIFFYQRAGFEKAPQTAGASWADGPSHLGAGQDPQSHAWLAKNDEAQVRDLRGGWFDAGDYNKYTSWTARNVLTLLKAYKENSTAFDDNSGIPESGNDVPDILDEVKWGLDWLIRMQSSDGSLLCVQGLAEASPPSAATGPSFYGPATSAATLMGAAAFAYAAKVYSARSEPEFAAFGIELANRAKQAWEWATHNPSVSYYNNDAAQQPGSQGLASGQQEMDDRDRAFAKLEAAIYLYDLTAQQSFAEFVEANFGSTIAASCPTLYDAIKQEALLYYTQLPNVSPGVKTGILAKFNSCMTENADQLPMVSTMPDPYRAPIKDYVWGSNWLKTLKARLLQLTGKYAVNRRDAETGNSAALDYVHYLHGVNPLGIVYLTNMAQAGAKHSASTMYHAWFAHGSKRWGKVSGTAPGPPPGYLVGGPNVRFALDSCCHAGTEAPSSACLKTAICGYDYSPPMNQPAMKSYLQFNDGWPANSWQITEPSTGYQAFYILVLSVYAR